MIPTNPWEAFSEEFFGNLCHAHYYKRAVSAAVNFASSKCEMKQWMSREMWPHAREEVVGYMLDRLALETTRKKLLPVELPTVEYFVREYFMSIGDQEAMNNSPYPGRPFDPEVEPPRGQGNDLIVIRATVRTREPWKYVPSNEDA